MDAFLLRSVLKEVLQKTATTWQMKLGGNGGKTWKQTRGYSLLFPLLHFIYIMFAIEDSGVVLKPD